MPSPVWPLPIWLDSGTYAILLFTASDFTSITSHIHNWVLFLFWLHLFILSGVISPLISSSILGTYRPGEFIFQCPIFLPFHTFNGVLKARILKWFAIPFSNGPCFEPYLKPFKSLQSCPTLCNPIDGSLPGSPVPGILQARTLERVAVSFSSAWKWKVKVKSLSCVWLLATPWTGAYQTPLSMGFARQEYWSGLPWPSPMYLQLREWWIVTVE